ncbi:MAG: antibiotic biosynthesis monooxygenase [Desulfobacter sp.]|nr:antibiotic biosynthesis monooxygenase [Desulfobacter sp.]WDP86297.1 MAG: antibiotic biosynthesis monooxygenase [Desulfobacter sp.]
MIVVRTTMNVLPEKHLEVLQTLLSLIAPVGAEPGCKSYCAFCDIDDKNRFTLLEEWETRKDLDRHFNSRRFGVLLGTKTLLCAPPEMQIHTISHTGGMEMIHSVRQSNN